MYREFHLFSVLLTHKIRDMDESWWAQGWHLHLQLSVLNKYFYSCSAPAAHHINYIIHFSLRKGKADLFIKHISTKWHFKVLYRGHGRHQTTIHKETENWRNKMSRRVQPEIETLELKPMVFKADMKKRILRLDLKWQLEETCGSLGLSSKYCKCSMRTENFLSLVSSDFWDRKQNLSQMPGGDLDGSYNSSR